MSTAVVTWQIALFGDELAARGAVTGHRASQFSPAASDTALAGNTADVSMAEIIADAQASTDPVPAGEWAVDRGRAVHPVVGCRRGGGGRWHRRLGQLRARLRRHPLPR